jgi:hypothetical protein
MSGKIVFSHHAPVETVSIFKRTLTQRIESVEQC